MTIKRAERSGAPAIVFNIYLNSRLEKMKKPYEKFIVIVRDPLKAALAEFNRLHSWKQDKETSHTGHAYLDEFKGSEWPNFVKKYYKSWTEFCDGVLSKDKSDVCLLIYENLVEDVIKELGLVSNKMSIVTIFNHKGHKQFWQNLIYQF